MTLFIDAVAWELGSQCRIVSPEAQDELEGAADDLLAMGFECFLRSEKTVTDLGISSLKQSLQASKLEPAAIDTLIFCTSTYPGPVSLLQAELEEWLHSAGFRHVNLFLLSFARCSNIASALLFAKTLLAQGQAHRVAIVTSDKHEPRHRPRNSQNNTQIMSDAAASCIVSLESGPYRVDGIWRNTDLAITPARLAGTTAERLAAYTHYHKLIRALGRSFSDTTIDDLVTHNMALPSIRAMASEFGISSTKLMEENVPRMGHAFCADGLVNLESCRQKMGPEGKARRVAMLLTGVNTHSAVLLEICPA
jgi:3-oxoacyl-[acyl-carrier-protein] synthase III